MPALGSVWFFGDARTPTTDAIAAAVEVARRNDAVLTVLGAVRRAEDRVFRSSAGARVLEVVRKDLEAW
ncbi:MAG TPA: hypothetical protein VD838_18510, partial [Anaeromyxobacteraceae bacterium]|nr:hypothetical protein [Anaeromyxobacteraceae bacterium]